MSTQSLSSDSTTDIYDIDPLSPHFRGLQSRFPRRARLVRYDSFVQLPDIANTQALVEYGEPQEELLVDELKQEFSEVLSRLTPIMKAKDAQLYRHSLRVQSLASALTSVLNLSDDEALIIGLAAFFHDIGKMGIHNTILHKASGLSHQEFEIIKRHPAYGATMLSQFRTLKNVVPSVYHHHERWDGKGYPDGIRGNAIPLGARIVAIVDAFEAMTSNRGYQRRRTPDQALEELYKCGGTQFDAELVRLFGTIEICIL